ncbi:MAG: hypothetical protein AAF667_01470 [Pseudomonadota bacterium]
MIFFRNTGFAAFATALTLAFGSCAASAATLTYTFEGGSLDFGFGVNTATVSGSFTFDTVLNQPTSANLTVSGAGALDGAYTVVRPFNTPGLLLRTLREGTDLSSDLTGLTAFDIRSDAPSASAGALNLSFAGIGTCANAICNGFSASLFQSSIMNGPIGNITPAPTPVPLPAAAWMLIVALGALVVPGASKAATISKMFSWVGDGGFSAKGSFSYDDTRLSVSGFAAASGLGPTTGLDELTVSFFDPSNTLLGTFNSVSGGVSSYEILLFEYSARSNSFVDGSFINIGADTGTPGEYFLVGQFGGFASLGAVPATTPTDASTSFNLTVSDVAPVPLPAGLPFFLFGIGSLAMVRRAHSR